MSDEKRPKPFALNPGRTSFTLRDLDNAQPRPEPPQHSLPHPRLAPPGMSGVKSSSRLGLKPQPSKEPGRLPGEAGHTSRVFKPLGAMRQKHPGHER